MTKVLLLREMNQEMGWIGRALAPSAFSLASLTVQAQTLAELPEILLSTNPAAVLCSLSPAIVEPAALVRLANEKGQSIPVIGLDEVFNLSSWIAWMRAGARNYASREMSQQLPQILSIALQGVSAPSNPQVPETEREREYLEATFAATTDFVAVCDPSGHVLWLNKAARRILRLSVPATLDGVLLSDCLPEPTVVRMLSEAIPVAIQQGVWNGEAAWLAGGTHEVPTSQVVVAHRRADAQVDFLSIIARDISERKRAEQILRQSEERFRAAAGCASDLIYEWDLVTGRQIWFGDIDGLLNHEPGQFPRTRSAWQKILHSEDQERVLEAVVRHLTTGTHFLEEYRVKSQGNLQHYWLDRGIALRDEAGKPMRWIGVVTDITDRKRSEAAIRASTRFARSTVDALSAHIAILNESGTIIAVNKAWRDFALTNQPSSRTAWKGANYLEVCDLATGDGAQVAAEFARGIRAVMSASIEEFTLEFPGHSPVEQRWYLGRVTRFADGGPLRIVVAHEDITARKLAEQEMPKGATNYHKLVDDLPAGIFRANLLGAYLYVNETWQELTGLAREAALGNGWQNSVHPEDRWVLSEWSRCVQDQSPGEFTYRVRRPDDTVLWVLSQIVLERDSTGAVIGFIGTTNNVTRLKATEEHLTQELKRLEHLIQSAGENHAGLGATV